MSNKHRVKLLEKRANPPQPWLILDIEGCPTEQQQAVMDEAKRTGRFTLCFEKSLNWAYVIGSGQPIPWEVNA